jgi:3-deoxy-D-manno-octulosonate 8-phosphate phosphatase (KDO 8-P phosphatase)
MQLDERLIAQARNVRGIVFDVDGVLTDGRIIYSDDGHELKQFNVQDGASLKLLAANDIAIAIITGRRSPTVARRARELGITHLRQGAETKGAALDELINDGFPATHNAAVGDDLQDIALFDHASVGLSITVPNAHPAALQRADYTTERRGGDGVAVEVAQLILTAQGKWAF